MAAAVLICAITACICSPSIAKSMKGFYRDIVRWDGAVVGVEYENATDEVRIDAARTVKEDGKLVLPLEVTLLDMSKEPYIRFMGEVALTIRSWMNREKMEEALHSLTERFLIPRNWKRSACGCRRR